jgi:transposase-like protein
MKRERRYLTAEFKACVAAEALKCEKRIQQIAHENDIAPTQVGTWKKELEDHMPSIFERKKASNPSAEKQERRTSDLGRKIDQLSSRKSSSKKVRFAGNRSERKAMIDPSDKKLFIKPMRSLTGRVVWTFLSANPVRLPADRSCRKAAHDPARTSRHR